MNHISARILIQVLAAIPLSEAISAATIGDRVWIDSNRNGQQDAGELGVGDIGLKLYWDRNGDGFPERLLRRTTTDANGNFSFTGVEPGIYSVGIEADSLPDNLYRATMLDIGDDATDNDVDRDVLRTLPIKVESAGQNLPNVADVGLMSYGGLVQDGTEVVPNHNDATYNVWLYNDIKFWTPISESVPFSTMEQWAKWYVEMELLQQQLHLTPYFLSYGAYSNNLQDEGVHWEEPGFPGETPNIGLRTLSMAWQTNASGAYSGGGDFVGSALTAPDDIEQHWSLLYEMNRANAGDWNGKATWPPQTFISAHLTTEMFLFKKGGVDLLDRGIPYNGLNYGYGLESIEGWKAGDFDFVEVFGDDTNDQGMSLSMTINGQPEERYAWGGTVINGFLNELYRHEGVEPVVEVLQNMIRKRRAWGSDATQTMLQFSDCVNRATDDRYAADLVDLWGLPDPALNPPIVENLKGSFGFANGDVIKIKGSNGLFVRHNPSTREIHCDATEANASEFTITLFSSGVMALQAPNGNYLTPWNGVDQAINSWHGNRPFEIVRFWFEDLGGGEVAFYSFLYDKYISSEAGTGPMIWNKTSVGATERFEIVGGSGEFPSPGPSGGPYSAPSVENDNVDSVTESGADIAFELNDGGGLAAVTLFYGASDGGTDASSWTGSQPVGARASGTHVAALSSLAPEASYFYAVQANNGVGEGWSESGSFVTEGLPVPPPVIGIGVNFQNFGGSPMGEQEFDGISGWTDVDLANGGPVAINGATPSTTVSWSSSNTYLYGGTTTPEDTLYFGYLDDGGAGCEVTLSGLNSWMAAEGLSGYTVRVYRNTDSGGHSFTDVEVYSDASLIDTILFTGGIANRDVADSIVLTADEITIDPLPNNPNPPPYERSTIAAVAVFGIELPGTSYATWAEANGASSDPGEDSNGNGVSNGIEFFMGGTQASPVQLPPVTDSGGNMVWTIPYDPEANSDWMFETSQDLQTWPDSYGEGDPEVQVLTDPDRIEFTMPTSSERLFVRLVVMPD